MTGQLYRIHGLVIRSDVALQGQTATAGTPDLVIARGRDRVIPPEPPPGRIIAEAWDGDRRFYTVVAAESAVMVRFHRWCDFVVAADGTTTNWHPSPEMTEDTVAVMAAGTVLAVALLLRGHVVLHASAVAVDGQALAFVGGSGMGKSTLATLLCRDGAALVTDDVLRVDGDRCFAGATAVRLRPHAACLASPIGGRAMEAAPWRTADGRLSLPLPTCDQGSMPLRAIIVPAVDKQGGPLVTAHLPPRQAVLALSSFPRVAGWQDPATAARQFEGLVELATLVPVWRCRVPWGPPFPAELAGELVRAIGWCRDADRSQRDQLSDPLAVL